MTESQSSPSPNRAARWYQPRIWHLALAVLFVAIAIVQIQDQRVHEPALVALAAGGFVLYAIIGVIGWRIARRPLESRLGPILSFTLFAIAMGALFLVATIIYLVIEHDYRNGR
jgi:xanthine/uracil permease